MKTITEFSGFSLRDLHQVNQALIQAKREELRKERQAQEAQAVPVASAEAAPAAPEAADAATQEASVEAVSAEASAATISEQPAPETSGDAGAPGEGAPLSESSAPEGAAGESSAVTAAVPGDRPSEPSNQGRRDRGRRGRGPRSGQGPTPNSGRPVIKPNLDAIQQREELKKAEELTREEFGKQVTEKLKLEGEKLQHCIHALQAVDPRRARDLKRVVVFSAEEGEKIPHDARKVGEHYYMAEYLPPLNPPKERGRFSDRGHRPGRDGKRGGRRGRGGKPGRGDGRGGGKGRPGAGPGGEGSSGRGRRDFRGGKPGAGRGPIPSQNRPAFPRPVTIVPKPLNSSGGGSDSSSGAPSAN